MSLFNYLLISGLFLLGITSGILPERVADCPNFEVEYEIESTQNEQFNLIISPTGGKAPYKIVLSEESGQLVTEDFNKQKFENLKKGKYICVVVDSDKCLRKTEISVQP